MCASNFPVWWWLKLFPWESAFYVWLVSVQAKFGRFWKLSLMRSCFDCQRPWSQTSQKWVFTRFQSIGTKFGSIFCNQHSSEKKMYLLFSELNTHTSGRHPMYSWCVEVLYVICVNWAGCDLSFIVIVLSQVLYIFFHLINWLWLFRSDLCSNRAVWLMIVR